MIFPIITTALIPNAEAFTEYGKIMKICGLLQELQDHQRNLTFRVLYITVLPIYRNGIIQLSGIVM